MITLTVSQLNKYVKSILEEDSKLGDLFLSGEISNFKNHYASGHLYFMLKDEKSSIRCVMFRSYAQQLQFTPEEGMSVLARGNVGLYEVDGSYQMYIRDMQPEGVGAVEIQLRRLIEKLDKKGYFLEMHKKPLPVYPKTIGVITSKTGAAIEDIKHVLERRYPLANVLFAPATVQGESAPASLVAALNALDGKCDVIIIGRGGGSKEDLWAFNNENLADAIFSAQTPIVSAVGHEVDVTICDMVADFRAATPSAAAELVVPSVDEIKAHIEKMAKQIKAHGKAMVYNQQEKLNLIATSPMLKNPRYLIDLKQKQLDFITQTMYNIIEKDFAAKSALLKEKAASLDGLSPFAVLSRGYTAVFMGEKPVKSVKELTIGGRVMLKFNDGGAEAIVDKFV